MCDRVKADLEHGLVQLPILARDVPAPPFLSVLDRQAIVDRSQVYLQVLETVTVRVRDFERIPLLLARDVLDWF